MKTGEDLVYNKPDLLNPFFSFDKYIFMQGPRPVIDCPKFLYLQA